VARSLSTGVFVAADLPLYEDRGGLEGGGYWTFAGFANDLAGKAFDFSAGAGWTYGGSPAPTLTANDALAPDGADLADKLADTNAASFSDVQVSGLTASNCGYSLWMQEATPAPGRPGCMAGDAAVSIGVTFPTGAAWRRVSARATGGTQSVYTIWPSGVQIGSVDHTYTGAIRVWGAQRVRTVNKVDLPLVDGTSGSCVLTLDASARAQLIDANGDLCLEFAFVPQIPLISDLGAGTAHFFFHMIEGGLETSFRYDLTNTRFIYKKRGVDHIITDASEVTRGGTTNQYWREGDEMTVLLWDLPSRQAELNPTFRACGIRVLVNGCCGLDKAGNTTGGAYATPTAVTLGSNGTPTSNTGMRWTKFGARKASTIDFTKAAPIQGVVIGDSTFATRNNDYIAVGVAMRTVPQARSRAYIGSMATGGDTAAGQQTKWDAATCLWRGVPMVGGGWASIGCGINEMVAQALTLAQIIANIQSLCDRVKVTNGGLKTVLFAVDPIKAYLDAINVNIWPNFYIPLNDAIMGNATAGNGFTIVTGVDARANEHLAILDPSSTGTTIAGYQVGDNLHVNNAGRAAKAGVLVTKLTALGFVP
jgi:hypothetical protein